MRRLGLPGLDMQGAFNQVAVVSTDHGEDHGMMSGCARAFNKAGSVNA